MVIEYFCFLKVYLHVSYRARKKPEVFRKVKPEPDPKSSARFTTLKYIQVKFPYMSAEKVKESVFVGPQIRKLTKDAQFLSAMTDVEKKHGFPLQKSYQNLLVTLKILTAKPLLKTCWLILKHLDVA